MAEEAALLASHLIGGELEVRNWRPGDRFQLSHSGNETKLKRLFSEESIPAAERPLWPVLVSGATIVWVRGFPVAHSHRWRPGSGAAVRIEVQEMP
jgi:tRNA(Ile)-lysidine synthetase-like protein